MRYVQLWWMFGLVLGGGGRLSTAAPKSGQTLVVRLQDLIAAAYVGSSELKSIGTALLTKDASRYAVDAALAPAVYARSTYGVQNPPPADTTTDFLLEQRTSSTQVLGARLPTAYGGLWELSATHQTSALEGVLQNTGLPVDPTVERDMGQFALDLNYRQSLWRNAFGRGTTMQRQAAVAEAQATQGRVDDEMQAWVVQLASRYTGIWEVQRRWAAARSRLQVFAQLLRAVEAKAQLGTADEADVLQIRANITQLEDEIARLEHTLMDTWEALVIALGLDKSYLAYTAATIDVVLEFAQADEVGRQCAAAKPPQAGGGQLQALEQELRSLRLNMQLLAENTKPELSLSARVNLAGTGQSAAGALDQAGEGKYPHWEVGLHFSTPIGVQPPHVEKMRLMARAESVRHRLQGLQGQRQTEWQQICSGYRLAQQRGRRLRKLVALQEQRAQIQRRRFDLGDTDMSQVTSALADLTTAQVQWRLVEAERHQLLWRYRQYTDSVRHAIRPLTGKGKSS